MRRSIHMRSVSGLLAGLAMLHLHAATLQPPSLRCASVDIAGDVVLTWVVPPDPTNIFSEYRIYASIAFGGPYVLVDSQLIYGSPTYTHIGAGANAGARFYYVTTVSEDPPPNESTSSDTLSTMYLQVSQSTPLGSAVLDWTFQHAPPIPTASSQVGIELEYPIGVWTPIDQIDVLSDNYEYLISICADSLTFRVALVDQLGCISYSNLHGDFFLDVTAPTPPDMVTVSVDTATNQVVLDWDPSPEPDTDGYIIFYIDGGNNYIIDTIYGQNNTSYVWNLSDAAIGAETYTVAAIDTCYSGDPPAPNTSATKPPHTSVFTQLTYDRCAASVVVQWTAYTGWPVSNYELYATFNGGAPFLLGTYPPTTFSATHDGLTSFSTYCYVVRAVGSSPSQRSLSNLACRVTDYPPVPQVNYLRTATVVAENHVVVIDSVDQNAYARRYRLQRTFNGEPWEEVATQPYTLSPTVVFNDLDTETGLRSYTYRVVVEDSCGVETITSNEGTSILLVVEAGVDGVNRLRWNGYGDWAGNVSGYAVYRSIAGAPFSPIAFNPPTVWELDDDVNAFFETNGLFCYYVEAIEVGNPSGLDATSTSNEACAVQQEAVWIPNAFIAGGHNDHFAPVFAYADVEGYELVIFNRWGQEIWSTTDRYKTWDGRVNDTYVPQGVYAYYCTFLNGAGKTVEERGTVTFLCCP